MIAKQAWTIQQRAVTTAGTLPPALTPSTIRFTAMRPHHRGPRYAERLRRALNVAVALVAIALTAPLMLLIALAVKLSSPGPVIYKQPRVGVDRRKSHGPGSLNHRRKVDQGGRIFTIYKFRTMRVEQGPARQVWASDRDPRITAVGRVLRAFRLDELPQLFNVLKGDMNIVGPRPEQPEIFQNLQQELGTYRYRQRVLPGITGLAQVSLPYDQSIDDVKKKVDLDLEYIRRCSPVTDLLIMARTMPVMVFRKGAL
ncbi:MAG TPA: sugar transferase [Longimicrobiales bacterium]|nr:sugar transferase [Longimicrobiales bacterium]